MRFRSHHVSGDLRLARPHGRAARPCADGAAAGGYRGGITPRAGSAVAGAPRPDANRYGVHVSRYGVNVSLTTFTKWPSFVTGLALVRPDPRPVSAAISYQKHRREMPIVERNTNTDLWRL